MVAGGSMFQPERDLGLGMQRLYRQKRLGIPKVPLILDPRQPVGQGSFLITVKGADKKSGCWD